ncbi:CHASE2 domain-containing protein [Chelativorans sp. YIM 93263]|uniref:CHASE2 domain-containing protein n=1 Tax=Chelativorans sp. YIM 93263 TaxID=2906648 RepID=UPI002377FE23|nr:adenylate/guanylate cyclase domain-containing protein [Chelativorans sp. YIM 93263]
MVRRGIFGGHFRKNGNRRRDLLVCCFGLAALGTVLFAALSVPKDFTRLSNIVFDAYQRFKPRTEAGAPVVIVDIDEASLRQLGQWPWPRTTMAEIVDRLGELGAAAIAFDMVFPEPDRTSPVRAIAALAKAGIPVELSGDATELDNDAVLGEAFSRNPVINGIAISNETGARLPSAKSGFAFGGADPKTYLPELRGGVRNLSILTKAASGVGFFSFPIGSDGVVRALPLVANAQGRLYPALSIEALRVAQDAGAILVRSTGASGEAGAGSPAMTAVKIGMFSVPTGPAGQFRVYYSGLDRMRTISAVDLLSGKRELRPLVDGHIVLVGTSAVGLRDLVTTPVNEALPGARVHAEIIDQIMGQIFLTRPDWIGGAESLLAVLLALAILALALRANPLVSSAAAAILVSLSIVISWFCFSRAQILFDPILPALAAAAVFTATMPVLLLFTDRERRFIRGAFGRYLSPTLVERLAQNPQALNLEGETRELTVLFSDIRGFTSLSERLDPDVLTSLLNDFLTPMTEVLLHHDATIDKYIGDAIMAFWNAPLDIADHPRKACLAALGMVDALERLNADEDGRLSIGIGLHSGACCVGNLGSAQRFSYSAIGDTVNLASRIEGLTKFYDVPVLVSDATRAGARDLAFVEVDRVQVTGRAEAVTIYALLGGADFASTPAFEKLADAHARLIATYRSADPDAAETALSRARAWAPTVLSRVYEVYGERLNAMRKGPPPPGWTGVFVAPNK